MARDLPLLREPQDQEGGVMNGHVCVGCGGTFEGRARLYCNPNCRRRTWDREKYRRPCPKCGADMDARPGRYRCRACYVAELHAGREARLEVIAAMYKAGVPLREIGALFGRKPDKWGSGSASMGPELDELRKRGLIGYRHGGWADRKAAP